MVECGFIVFSNIMFHKDEVSLQSVIQELLQLQTADPKSHRWDDRLPRGALLSRSGSEGPLGIQKLAAEGDPARRV